MDNMKLLNRRLDSQSRRINNLNQRLHQILSNQQHYLRYRLPDVLANEKRKREYWKTFSAAKRVLQGLSRAHMMSITHKKLSTSGRRFIGYFTDVEISRLRHLLKRNLKTYIIFHNAEKQVVKLTRNEKSRLKFLIKNSTAIDRLVRKKKYKEGK